MQETDEELTPRQMLALIRRHTPWLPDYDDLPEWGNAREWSRVFRWRSPTYILAKYREGYIPTTLITAGGKQQWRVAHKDDMIRYAYRRVRGPNPIDGVAYTCRVLAA